jgi:hypothetical protein
MLSSFSCVPNVDQKSGFREPVSLISDHVRQFIFQFAQETSEFEVQSLGRTRSLVPHRPKLRCESSQKLRRLPVHLGDPEWIGHGFGDDGKATLVSRWSFAPGSMVWSVSDVRAARCHGKIEGNVSWMLREVMTKHRMQA